MLQDLVYLLVIFITHCLLQHSPFITLIPQVYRLLLYIAWVEFLSAIFQLLQGRINLFKSVWQRRKILKEITTSIKENLSQSVKGVALCFLDN